MILIDMKLFQQMRNLVKKVPKGKVTTYGTIAKTLGMRNNRLVGWAMHSNKDPLVPCHRVVFKNGSLAPGYAFGGPKIQKEKLAKEGVKFTKEGKVKPAFFFAGLTYKPAKPAAR